LRGTRLEDSEYNFITPEHAERLKNANVYRGDVIFTHAGNIGQAAYIPPSSRYDRYVISQRQFFMRCNTALIRPSFVAYYFKTHEGQHKLLANSSPSGVPSIAQPVTYLRSIELPVPPLLIQDAIANILGSLDDKIELNRRMNQTLEEIARAIFKSWFVDFDPVRAKAAVRREHPNWTNEQVSRAACPKLKPEIAELFPDAFEDSELGEIPKGWEVTTLGDFVEFVKGRSYRSDELSSSDTALVTLKSFVRGGGYRIDGLKPFTGAYIPKQVVEPGEVVLACTDVTQAGEVIGRTAIVRGSRTYSCLVASLDVLIIRPRPPLTRSFVYELGRSADFVDHTYAHTIGTTVLHLSTDAVAAFPFAMPPSALIDRYDQIAVPIIQRSEAIGGDSEMLAAIRDALLPKLISNELRIPDAESFIARAQAAAMEATS